MSRKLSSIEQTDPSRMVARWCFVKDSHLSLDFYTFRNIRQWSYMIVLVLASCGYYSRKSPSDQLGVNVRGSTCHSFELKRNLNVCVRPSKSRKSSVLGRVTFALLRSCNAVEIWKMCTDTLRENTLKRWIKRRYCLYAKDRICQIYLIYRDSLIETSNNFSFIRDIERGKLDFTYDL